MANPLSHPLPIAAPGGEGSSVCGPGMDGLRGVQVELAGGVLRLNLQGDARGLSCRAAIARGQALRSGLLGAIDAATQGEVRAIVLSLDGWDWALDEDRTAPETTAEADAWVAICRRLADVGRPVIATVSGTVAGDAIAGLLAAQYVIAQADARLSLPQAGLGRLPAGGILGRLAGRIGAARTLDLALARRGLGARRALALGVVDSVSVPDPVPAALTMARLIASGRQGLPPRSPAHRALADSEAYLDAITAARGQLARMRPARARLVARLADVVEARLLLNEGSAALFESEAWALQRSDPAAAALGHLAWAARQVAAGLPRPQRRPRLRAVTVLGGTPLAADLAHGLITAGMAVTLVSPEGPALAEMLRQIAVAQDAAVRSGRLSVDRREQDWSRLQAGLAPSRGAGADLVIEAGDLTDSEAAVSLAHAGSVARRGALLVTARPRSLRVPGSHAGGKGTVCGFVLPEPAGGGHLAEIVVPAPDPTAPTQGTEAQAVLANLAHRLGRVAILVRSGPGGLAAMFCDEGRAAIRAGLAAGLPKAALTDCLAELGWALPTDPVAGPMAMADPAVAAIAAPRPDSLARAEWRDWLVAALADLGARLIEGGILSSAAEVDLVATEGAGLARDTGGPMHMADRLGLVRLRALLRVRAEAEDGPAAPCALWDHHIRNARPFAGSDLQVLVARPVTA